MEGLSLVWFGFYYWFGGCFAAVVVVLLLFVCVHVHGFLFAYVFIFLLRGVMFC